MDTYAFLTELKEHNQREWFLKSKERYEEHVRTPALQFVSAAAPAMAKISQYLVADPRPSGGSLFRIHRDLRFSRDKTPYNPEIGIQIGHREARSRLFRDPVRRSDPECGDSHHRRSLHATLDQILFRSVSQWRYRRSSASPDSPP